MTDALTDAAAHYYVAMLLFEDEDVDPDDHLGVVRTAFSSADCDDFAFAVREATGCAIVRIDWIDRGGGYGHHTLNRTNDGRLFDVHGWTDAAALRRRYGIPKNGAVLPQETDILPGDAFSCGEIVEDLKRIASILPLLPDGPFADGAFPDAAARLSAAADTFAEPVESPSP